MASWKLVVEYDGTDFFGWQVQPSVRTVQGELNQALSRVLGETVQVTGAGRTDAGVHARGQVASFSVADGVDVSEAIYGVNCVLPEDVTIRSAEVAPAGFNARRDASRRHYRYRLHNGFAALERRTSLRIHPQPDVEAMRAAAVRVPGCRDYVSFASGLEPGDSTLCEVVKCSVEQRGRLLTVDVSANRFLRKMVRTLVGTLLEVGWGKHPPQWMDDVLEARDRRAAGAAVAPTGLFLMAVDYPAWSPEQEDQR